LSSLALQDIKIKIMSLKGWVGEDALNFAKQFIN